MRKSNVFNANLVYFLIVVLFVVVRICTALNLFDFLGTGKSIVLSIVVQIGILFMLPFWLITKLKKQTAGQTLEETGFKRTNWKTILISIAIGFIVFFLNIAISTFFSYFLSALGYSVGTTTTTSEATWEGFALSILTVAILPAICEEFTHRGVLLSNYKTLGFKRAVIYSSLLFGLLHLNIEQFFYASIIGAVLAVVALFSKSIIPAIIIHFMNNAINVYLDFASAKNLPFGNFYSTINNFLSTGSFFANFIFIVLLLGLLIMLLVYLITKLLKINAETSLKEYAEKIAIDEMRREVLGEDAGRRTIFPLMVNKNHHGAISINVPYEVLGFYMAPQCNATAMDNLFFYASIVLGGLVTLATFIWGVI